MSSTSSGNNGDVNANIHHVVLIGFHHKKGCVIEYCYPPLHNNDGEDYDPASTFLPAKWHALPSLAMPDGAHNFSEDVVYFHLPPLTTDVSSHADETIYCVSYCRQVDADQISQKDEQVTRGTVQKSVVVLSKVPAFGLIKTKLQLPMIANAFLENFNDKNVIVELYDQLATSLRISDESHYFFGFECRDLVLLFRRKLLSLFKLILLEKRVIFHTTRASILVDTLLSLLSLYPRMIETGLSHATDLRKFENPPANTSTGASNLELSSYNENKRDSSDLNAIDHEKSADEISTKEEAVIAKSEPLHPPTTGQSMSRFSPVSKMTEKLARIRHSPMTYRKTEGFDVAQDDRDRFHLLEEDDNDYVLKLENARLEMTVGSPEKSVNTNTDQSFGFEILHDEPPLSPLVTDRCGYPLNLFTNGHVCLPYVSLQQHDLLKENSCRGYLVGATNILFVAQRDLSDVVVDVGTGTITYHNPQLENLLSLSPADLRFTEDIMENTLQENENYFNRAAEWKGGDEWLRGMFAEYLNNLLYVVANESSDPRKVNDFNDAFVREWRQTKNFRTWCHKYSHANNDVPGLHPFHGQFSMSDVRLRLNHKLQDSEQGRKIQGALSNANDTLVNTGRYFGNAFGSAKSWFSNKLQSSKRSQSES